MTNPFNEARVRPANDREPNPGGRYVLYWMQAARRMAHNHALDHALHWSGVLKRPLVVFEGVRVDYPWASARHHRFLLDGMADNAAAAKRLGVSYWPFVETPDNSGRGLVRNLAEDACLVVTDDYPAFVVPAHTRAVAAAVGVAVHAVDGNGVVPLAKLGPLVSAAAHLRPRIHLQFAEAWDHRAAAEPDVPRVAKGRLAPPFEPFDVSADVGEFVAALPVDQSVPAVPGLRGVREAGLEALAEFVQDKLPRYATDRNQPDDPDRNAASRLSPYLRHGHISIQEVAEAVLNDAGPWTPAEIDMKAKGKRDGFYTSDANVNGYLDEAITWRDVGYHWHFRRNAE